jgi:thiosulfate/3-mercaptopyruvate sulfurtransferase
MSDIRYSEFITTGQLAELVADPLWVIVDCTFDLAEPGWGEENYLEGHIPGAVYAHMDLDLSGPITPSTGRHPLPDPQKMAEKLSQWGIGPSSQVVVYDTANGAFASRLWWMLHYYGHERAAILEGGYAKWISEDRPLVPGKEHPHSPAHFTVNLRPEMVAAWGEVDKIRSDPHWKLVDARSAVRFRGEQEPIDKVAGHIPGALNRFHGENLNSDGTLLAQAELRRQFNNLLGETPPEKTIVYCGSGVTSCLHIAVMQHAGLGLPRLYAGSWSEWIRDPSRAITKNSQA